MPHRALLGRRLRAAARPRSEIIANFSVGFDHVDIEAARKKGVVVTNTPDVLSDATAELTMMLMIGAARRASEGERLVREGKWKDWSPAFMVGTQVTGKRLGILGMGRVGQVVARRARGFDMTIHYHDASPAAAGTGAGRDLPRDARRHASPLRFPHASLQRDARDARADERRAIRSAARRRHPRERRARRARRRRCAHRCVAVGQAAGRRHRRRTTTSRTSIKRLVALPNTFLMPHIGSATAETRDAMGFRALDNLDAYFAGREPRDRIA